MHILKKVIDSYGMGGLQMMIFDSIFFSLIATAIGLFILYLVVSKAVKDGINNSAVGQLIEKNYGPMRNGKPFPASDLDNDK